MVNIGGGKNIFAKGEDNANYVNHVKEITGKNLTVDIFEYEYGQIDKKLIKRQ